MTNKFSSYPTLETSYFWHKMYFHKPVSLKSGSAYVITGYDSLRQKQEPKQLLFDLINRFMMNQFNQYGENLYRIAIFRSQTNTPHERCKIATFIYNRNFKCVEMEYLNDGWEPYATWLNDYFAQTNERNQRILKEKEFSEINNLINDIILQLGKVIIDDHTRIELAEKIKGLNKSEYFHWATDSWKRCQYMVKSNPYYKRLTKEEQNLKAGQLYTCLFFKEFFFNPKS